MKKKYKKLDHDSICGIRSSLPSAIISHVEGDNWRLDESYSHPVEGNVTITVPKGFIFDLASVPKFARWFITPFELSIIAPLVHDFIYVFAGKVPSEHVDPTKVFTRLEADVIFLKIMEEEKISLAKRQIAYRAVRTFGWLFWNSKAS